VAQIEISAGELDGFTAQAAADLENAVRKYKSDLLREISRIEASQHAGDGGPEVTSAMVHDAELVYSRGPRYRRKKGWLNFGKVVAVVCIFISGAMADSDFLNTYPHIILFLAMATVAILSSTVVTIRE
jgi:hypothetical protein